MAEKYPRPDLIQLTGYGKDVKFYFDRDGKFWKILSREGKEKMTWLCFERMLVAFFQINKLILQHILGSQ